MLVDDRLKKYLSFDQLPEQRLLEAIQYSLFAGGKRIRPVLMLAVSEVLGGEAELILPAACAVEMVHTYSLIHDDLPAMDNDDYRRGKLTCHKKYDEATAILAGDTLQCTAYEVLARGSEKAGVDPIVIIKLIKELGRASGLLGMAGGQMLDINSDKKISYENLKLLHSLKTGALLKYSIFAPLCVFSPEKKKRTALLNYADAVGLAFQIKDDILDVEGTKENLGKTPGKDKAQTKATYVSILGLKKAKECLLAETQKAYNSVKLFGKANVLLDLAKFLLERNK